MTSYKSSHAFEGIHASRTPLPRNAAHSHSHSHLNSNLHAHASDARDVRGRRSDSISSSQPFDFPSLTQPHSIPHSIPHSYSQTGNFSTSFVREQSLALGNLERGDQSYESKPLSPDDSLATLSSNQVGSTTTGPTSGTSTLGQIDTQLEQDQSLHNRKSRRRDGADRSPPSGLSLLLKTKDQDDDDSTSKNRTNEAYAGVCASAGTSSEAASELTGKRSKRQTSISLPPAPIDTSLSKCLVEPVGYIPAVILGLLLNLLDAVSYGMIIFPLNQAPFQALGPDGISMFFVSCVVSQLVYSLGGSAFKGGNGSMMIEVVPFLHLMAETVVARVGVENRDAVLATTILAYALSTIMTGAVFLALGYFKLGSLIAFFPRHILVGCIGGVGWFLIVTGLEVSSRMTTELTYTFETFKFLFLNAHVFALWSSAFGLALLLRVLQHKIRHPFLVPVFFMVVPAIFYAIVAICGFEWDMLRSNGWVFPMPEGDAPGWQFYSYFNLKLTNWRAILETVPAMLALTFFGILHVPINVPALGVSTGHDNIDTNRELVAHGWSNLLSGGVGTVQNYLVYTNSLLFIKSGGDSRVAGVMLAIASLIVFLIGPWIVGYIPVMVVGSLIFHLGLDLVKEALWDTWGLVHHLEYLTIALIVVVMAGFGFVEGIFFGILLACVFFVVTNSRKESVRYSCTGESAKSTVRRVYRQQKFLRQVGRQIYIFKLQGDMFFGTINKVEKEIQDVFSRRRWEVNPIQFLVLDFSLVRGVDFSAAEGFGRIRRAVRAKGVCLVLSGLDEEDEVGKALQMVGVWGAGAGAGLGEGHGHGANFAEDGFDTQSFPGLSEALEFCENCLLETYYRTRESTLELAKPNERPYPHPINLQQPVPTLLAAFHDTRENSTDFFLRLSMYFERRTVLAGTILWRQGGAPIDGLYLVEDGTLRSIQEFQDSGLVRRSVEVILPGTISGEIGLFTGNNRSSTLVAETDGILWGLSQDRFQKMIKEDPALAVEFMRVAMSYSAERLNTMVAYAFSLS
ncbi:sulfate transporter family-domain-containing protein [Lobosporangium transversale]|uniref:Sulfate transporter family-domain-containing protein n=1 Tax=Lobosporangium transversale TaxID=64571 RepID=A0A1Y2GB32_9FUNG|nr:sulfate transporter family-domain-containing protein [Lobosporangium transversale]ORZ05874.1 sulfate transporter family-domain-containing protein [Lobosporangium transversale]|eukprot:XP_021877255.1 sulfate transporter family-domain-containing protein [Lobosporangium transversale]